MFFRSENVDWLTRDGWQQLYDAGIRTVVDLRQQRERDMDTQGRPDWLHTVHIDLDGLENTEFWADYWDCQAIRAGSDLDSEVLAVAA